MPAATPDTTPGALVAAVYPQALAALGERPTRATVRAAVEAGHAAAQGAVDGLAAESESRGSRVACRSGCAFCCHQHIAASPAELLVLADHIAGWPEDRRAELRARLERDAPRIAALGPAERAAAAIACPLLDRRTKLCTAYGQRPTPCRSHLSLLRTACERDFRNRGVRRPGDKPVPILQDPKTAAGAVQVAVDLALDWHGLNVEPVEIAVGLRLALADPAVFDRWLAGEAPFPILPPHPDSRRARLGLSYADMLRAERERLERAGRGSSPVPPP